VRETAANPVGQTLRRVYGPNRSTSPKQRNLGRSKVEVHPDSGLFMRKFFQTILGAALCIGIVAGIVYSPLPLFWEHEDQPLVYSITWRSGVVLLLLVLLTQLISHFLFTCYGKHRKQESKTGDSILR